MKLFLNGFNEQSGSSSGHDVDSIRAAVTRSNKKCLYIIAAICFAGAAHTAAATDIYVQQGSTATPAKGTLAAPYTSIYTALTTAGANIAAFSSSNPPQPQNIYMLTPVGTPSSYGSFIEQYSGVANGYINIIGDPGAPNMVKVIGDGRHFGIELSYVPAGQTSELGVSYVSVMNLDVSAPGPWNAIFVDAHSHHIQVSGNSTHDSGYCGISTYKADYLNISYNKVYNNASYYSSAVSPRITCSGISTFENKDFDSYTGIKSVINGNLVYNNTNNNSGCTGSCSDPDGSGIIVDDSSHSQSDRLAYGGTTLITNNIVTGNGGRGIYISQSDHVLVENNSSYHNNQDPQEGSDYPGEIEVYGIENGAGGGGGDIKIYNNIAYSDGLVAASQSPNASNGYHTAITVGYAGNDGSGGVTSDYNMLFADANRPTSLYVAGGNNANVVYGSHNATANPLFVSPSTTIATANFKVQSTSPALHVGLASYAPCLDFASTVRPSTNAVCDPSGSMFSYNVDLGAYQQTTH